MPLKGLNQKIDDLLKIFFKYQIRTNLIFPIYVTLFQETENKKSVAAKASYFMKLFFASFLSRV